MKWKYDSRACLECDQEHCTCDDIDRRYLAELQTFMPDYSWPWVAILGAGIPTLIMVTKCVFTS